MSWNEHDHRGEYAADRHDHDGEYAEKWHRHYDMEREDERLQAVIRGMGETLNELRNELRAALERVSALEGDTPQARQLQAELDATLADNAAAGYGEDYYPEPEDDGEGEFRWFP